ncbi:MAG: acyl-CoA dehydrogenase [Ignavibacteria bacterium]|jgi:glutaryl-CoA dehydrogenase|nr:acyl-CoA dehydrogenase [Ignavibacteria bacterium]
MNRDFFHIDDLLSNEEIMLRNTVREFTNKEIIPIIGEYYEKDKFPDSLIPKLAELGLFGMVTPSKYGGYDMSYVDYGLAMQELERGDSAVRSFCSVQNSLVMFPICEYGTEEQKQKWLPKLASGKAIGCFGLTEANAGSDPAGMLTTAVKTENGYLLNGSKMWITNGCIADIAIVWAKLNGKVHGFIVEKGTPGFSTVEMKHKLSLRASVTSELIFNNCEVSSNSILTSTGMRAPLSCLTSARYGIAWGTIGSAMAVYQSSLDYAKERKQFGKPIAAFQLIQDKLVWMLTEITKGQLLNLQLGKLMDNKKAIPANVSLAKRNNCEFALEAARVAREIHGANGISNEYCIMRHSTNLESVKTYEGTHEMHTLIVGKEITGEDAFN